MSLERVRIDELLRLARSRGATDLHLGGNAAPTLRVDGRLVLLDAPPIAADALRAFLLTARTTTAADGDTSTDFTLRRGPGAPCRVHAYETTAGPRIACRLLAADVPALEELGLPAVLSACLSRPNGLLLFTGPTGSGKTTALAGAVDRINRTSERLIVTVEDPIEYVHTPIRSLIAHCQIGVDVPSYPEALRGFLRADPDVILVGEMRDRPTIEAALSAAETGHLVLSTLHTNDAPQTVDRIVDVFASASQAQVRAQLAATLMAIVSLRLVPALGGGRIAAAEVMLGTEAVRAMIRDGKTHQLRNAIATGRALGMQTLEASLSELVVRGRIALEVAMRIANRPSDVRGLERAVG